MSEFLYVLSQTNSNYGPSAVQISDRTRPRTNTVSSNQDASKGLGISDGITFSTLRPSDSSSNGHLSANVSDSEGRSGAGTPAPPSGAETPGDINKEVQVLSDKLIIAINHQTTLEEGLEDTRAELDMSKKRIEELEAIAKEHADMMATGLLIEKKDVEMETKMLMNKLMEETFQRGKAEKEKRTIEQDLENLTTSLFEEANKMVVAARKEREAVLRRNDQLEQQLADTAVLLQTHQEQLMELKEALQHMTHERDELEAMSSTPSTPAMHQLAVQESLDRVFEALHIPSNDDVSPAPPTSYDNIIQPVLRNDIAAYKDFCTLVRMSKHFGPSLPPGQQKSTLGSFSMLGLSGSPNHSPKISPTSIFGHSSARSISSIHSNHSSSSLQINTLPPAPPLKETPFFKRVLMEDVEPTLRLDTAPGLSWLARRTVLSGVIEGTLVIEAMPFKSKLPIFPCALCGESRNDSTHARLYRFRANETEGASKYPLCTFCCNRVRSVCEFLAFLRTAKEGHLKCESDEDEQAAWEESVKLREKLFWSRIGGGVVPSFSHLKDEMLKSYNSSRENLGDISPIFNNMRIGPAPPPLPPRKSTDLSRKDETVDSLDSTPASSASSSPLSPVPPAPPAKDVEKKEVEAPKTVAVAVETPVKEEEKFIDAAETVAELPEMPELPSPPAAAAAVPEATNEMNQLPSPPASPVDQPSKPAEIAFAEEKTKILNEQAQETEKSNDAAIKA